MNLDDLKLINLKIDKEKFGKIYSFIDFGNVNYWYEKDERDSDGNIIEADAKLVIGLQKLADFSHLFSERSRFYYGFDPRNSKSVGFIDKTRFYFDKTITKPIQKIKHYLDDGERKITTRRINNDSLGNFVYIPKCNFDVEICVDAIRLLDQYDTFCIFSSDADFARLIEYLRKKNKKVILIKSGFVQHNLKRAVDLVISAQDIKPYIAFIKQKSRP